MENKRYKIYAYTNDTTPFESPVEYCDSEADAIDAAVGMFSTKEKNTIVVCEDTEKDIYIPFLTPVDIIEHGHNYMYHYTTYLECRNEFAFGLEKAMLHEGDTYILAYEVNSANCDVYEESEFYREEKNHNKEFFVICDFDFIAPSHSDIFYNNNLSGLLDFFTREEIESVFALDEKDTLKFKTAPNGEPYDISWNTKKGTRQDYFDLWENLKYNFPEKCIDYIAEKVGNIFMEYNAGFDEFYDVLTHMKNDTYFFDNANL
jgi:hypothetical protein